MCFYSLNDGPRYAREPKAKNEMHAAGSTPGDLSTVTSVQIDALGVNQRRRAGAFHSRMIYASNASPGAVFIIRLTLSEAPGKRRERNVDLSRV